MVFLTTQLFGGIKPAHLSTSLSKLDTLTHLDTTPPVLSLCISRSSQTVKIRCALLRVTLLEVQTQGGVCADWAYKCTLQGGLKQR